jgi:outer membrane beta-barrel protein
MNKIFNVLAVSWAFCAPLAVMAATPAPENVPATQAAPVVPGSVIPAEQQPIVPGSVIPAEPQAAVSPGKAAKADAEPTLESQLDSLSVPTNQAPPGVAAERLYAVQTRYVTLRHRHELALGGGKNFNTDSFVSSQNLDASYRFYLNDRWFLGLSGSYVFNDWSNGADRLIKENGTNNSTLADVAFARYRADLLAGYHLFYGKFRVSMDQVFYFDQYIALGPGYVDMVLGNQFAAVGEVGFVFWFGRSFSVRLGLKDYFVREMRTKSNGWAHNLIGGAQFGYVFGG